MDLTLPSIDIHTLPDFTTDDLADVLSGAQVLEDIERYREAKKRFENDQNTARQWVERTLPARLNMILNRSINTLFDVDTPDAADDDVDATDADDDTNAPIAAPADPESDPHAKLDVVLDEIQALKDEAKEYVEGPAAQKRLRFHEALQEVYEDLRVRVSRYKDNLPTQRALSVLMDDEDDSEDDQPAQGLAAQDQAKSA